MFDATLKQYNIRFIMTIFRRTTRYTDHNDRYVAVQFLSFVSVSVITVQYQTEFVNYDAVSLIYHERVSSFLK